MCANTSSAARRPNLLDRVREAARVHHLSYRTEQAYVDWVKRFVLFHGKRHPRHMGKSQVEAFLTHLAVEGQVTASTQNQALAAMPFLYRHVLDSLNPSDASECHWPPTQSPIAHIAVECALSSNPLCHVPGEPVHPPRDTLTHRLSGSGCLRTLLSMPHFLDQDT